jgi:hypothetical protein
MQQVQTPISPVANILMASAVWRKVHTDWNFFKCFHGSSEQVLVRALKFSTMMPIQHVF